MNTIEYIELAEKQKLNNNQLLKIKKYNQELIEKYPFLKPAADDYDYSYTLMDDMPVGWRIAFGDIMLERIRDALLKMPYNPKDNYDEPALCQNDTWLNHYRIFQIKEKYGSLRWYDSGGSKELYDIIREYENLSEITCINCGKPAKYLTQGWICPYCEDCIDITKANVIRLDDIK